MKSKKILLSILTLVSSLSVMGMEKEDKPIEKWSGISWSVGYLGHEYLIKSMNDRKITLPQEKTISAFRNTLSSYLTKKGYEIPNPMTGKELEEIKKKMGTSDFGPGSIRWFADVIYTFDNPEED